MNVLPLDRFLFTCCVTYRFVSFGKSFNISGLKNSSNISQGEPSWVIWKFLFIPGTPGKVGFWTEFVLPILKSELARLGTALCVLFLPLPSFHWKTSFSSLLLKGEFTLHVSLSESSLKLPPSEYESFKISLIFSVPIKCLWSVLRIRTRSGIFRIACNPWNNVRLVRPRWYFRPAR